MSQHSKRYRAAVAQVDKNKFYTPTEAVALIKAQPPLKFDA